MTTFSGSSSDSVVIPDYLFAEPDPSVVFIYWKERNNLDPFIGKLVRFDPKSYIDTRRLFKFDSEGRWIGPHYVKPDDMFIIVRQRPVLEKELVFMASEMGALNQTMTKDPITMIDFFFAETLVSFPVSQAWERNILYHIIPIT